jgi:transposase
VQPLRDEVKRLRRENAALKLARDAALADVERLKKLYDALCFEYSKLRRKVVGPTREHVPANDTQQSLFEILDVLGRLKTGDTAAESTAEALLDRLRSGEQKEKPEKKTPHGRRDFSTFDLPVERIVLEPAERQLPGGEQLEKIGEEVSEVIERRPGSFVRVQVVRPKYKVPEAASSSQTSIVIAPPLEHPLPKGMAGPGLLSHVMVSKFADHIPLHRQERIFEREGLDISRSTLCGWIAGCTGLLKHIVDAMWEDARANAPWVAVDATGILVQAIEQCRRLSFYVVVAGEEHVLFGSVKKNDGPQVAELLKGFGGRPMLSDASSVYHELQRREARAKRAIIEVGCWSHARRGAFDALPTDRERALVIIGLVGLLYEAHRNSTNDKGVTDGKKRRELATPIVDELYRYIEAERPKLVEGTPIDQAFGYFINQKVPLLRFLDDGRLRLDNNPSELELRREVVGRKNWLFLGSDDAAAWNTTIVSLIASCHLHAIEPWAYLRDVLTLLPGWKQGRALQLSPKHWVKTSARPDVQERLGELRLLDRA